MNCAEVQKVLVFYLDEEVAPGDRRSIQQHLAGCRACRQELDTLAHTRYAAGQVLQGLAAPAVPSPQARSRLQARLAEAANPSQSGLPVWLSRLAPGARANHNSNLEGDQTMLKRITVSAVATALVLALFAAFVARSVTPASAQQILERAYEARSAADPAHGIRHTKIESYSNMQALQGNPTGTRIIHESYANLETGDYRAVSVDASGGKVLSASAYDGSFVYTGWPVEGQGDSPLTIYRAAQSREKVADPMANRGTIDAHDIFNSARNDPHARLVGQQTWTDGRKVYIVESQAPAKVELSANGQPVTGMSRLTFDARTYQLLESRLTVTLEGKEVLIASTRTLVDEILPDGSPVAWDLSDLQGVNRVDDPQGKHSDLLPEIISAQDVAANAPEGYLLKSVPEGFELEISAPARQAKEQPYIYIASYRNPEGDYFVIQFGKMPAGAAQDASETYTTASGLALCFLDQGNANAPGPDGKPMSFAAVSAPNGTGFLVTSNLPREQVKLLAETLAPVK